MLGLFTRRRPPAEAKASRAGRLIAFQQAGRPCWSGRDFHSFAREGFERNPVAHRCLRLIAETTASVPWTLGADGAEDRALDAVLARPNPHQSGRELMERLILDLLIAGNAYAEAVGPPGTPAELHALRPDRTRVIVGDDGWPEAYEYAAGGRSIRIEAEPDCPVLHLRLGHPLDDHYGLPPMAAAAGALDIHNAASAWSKAFLDNAARPSGALVYASEGANLTDEQYERLKAELESNFQGPENAGRPLLLEGGLDWKPLSLSPKDMDFMALKAAAARDIALALGVPPLILGLPGDSTHANYAEANRAFWRQTVAPLSGRLAASFAGFLSRLSGRAVTLVPDFDGVEGMAETREPLWRAITAADFLTVAEKREALGYPPRPPERDGTP